MRRTVCLWLSLALLIAPAASRAEAPSARSASDLFDWIFGDDAHELAPEPTPAPTLDAEFLFGDLFKDRTAAPDATPEPTPEPTPRADAGIEGEDGATGPLFDDGVRLVTSSAWGGKVDFAHVMGWTVSRGYFDGQYCLTGIPPEGGTRVVLSDGDPVSFVPAGDAVVYFGEGTKGDYGWLSLVPGERRPLRLPLDAADEVFFADERFLWYFTPGGGDAETVGRMLHDGSKKKKLGTIKGRVVAVMPGDEVLLVNFSKNRVQLWKDGEYRTIYGPERPIVSVVTTGRHIWIEHDDGFGLLEDGRIDFALPGRIAGTAGTSDQFALLVAPDEDAAFFDAYLFNEPYRAYAWAGLVRRSDGVSLEFQQDQMIAWGPEESVVLGYPIPELWLPYGYYDFASAENRLSDEGWAQMLVGSWCADASVGAGYGERLIFADGAYYRLPAQGGGGKAKARRSAWSVSDGWLVDGAGGEAPRFLRLSGPFTVPPDEGPYSPRIAIDGRTYYQYSDDPAYFEDLKAYGVEIEASVRSPKAHGGEERP